MSTAARHPLQFDTGRVHVTVRQRYVVFLGCVLLGYSLCGRGFAYVGFPPIFIGEIALLTGLAMFTTAQTWREVLTDRTVWPLLGLFAWGALQTAPYVSSDGIDAIRDAVVWGYGVFAVVLAGLILDDPSILLSIVKLYSRFTKIFLIGIPIAFALYRFAGGAMPQWPWANVGIVQVKEGDALVHLAGVMAFWIAGIGGAVALPWVALLVADAALLGVIDRAGMVAFGAVFVLCMIFRPGHKLAWKAIGAIVVVCLALWLSDLHVPIPGGKGRDVSFEQVVTNLMSVAGDSGSNGLDSTKEWRLDWWKAIRGYTIHGRYFWTGKGFGINLADDDGFQVLADHSLRNPHSVHMTMLARGGVPMLCLWAGVNLTWLIVMGLSLLRARLEHQRFWEGLLFFLISYWMAFLINGSFDVFIEGPMGGIWFWSIYGTGLGAVMVRKLERKRTGTLVAEATRPRVQRRARPGRFSDQVGAPENV